MNDRVEVPQALVDSIRGYYADEGDDWLTSLPKLLRQAANRWQLDLGMASSDAGTGMVCFARDAEGRDRVLKVAFPGDEHFTGVEAMRVYAGRGCVRMLATAAGGTQVLMERVLPGSHLHHLEDESAEVRIAAGVIKRLHRPPPTSHALPPHSTWVDKSLRYIAASNVDEQLFPRRLVTALEKAVADLAALGRTVVLHGDLHDENILKDDELGWLAIDPKGLTGDPALEIGRYMGNKRDRADAAGGIRALSEKRLELFAKELGEPFERLRAAASVDVIMCMGWELEKRDFDVVRFAWQRDFALALVD